MTQLGKYELHEQLGRGGFGTVYRAIDTTLGREVALKVLHPQLTTDPDFLERFRNEARLVASLDSPNIVTIHELGESEGRVFIAMKYLAGGSLKQRLEKEGALPFDEAVQIMGEVCAGLEAAHKKGLVHRDIKPGNILFDSEGRAVLGDFGLARAIQASSASAASSTGGVGTPAYRAPELWLGKPPASPATDIYSLGCVLSEMLSGKILFDGSTTEETLTKHLITGPNIPESYPSSVPAGVLTVVKQAVAKEMKDRYQKVTEFNEALTASIQNGDEPLPIPPQYREEPELLIPRDEMEVEPGLKPQSVLVPPPVRTTVPEGKMLTPKKKWQSWQIVASGLVVVALVILAIGASNGWFADQVTPTVPPMAEGITTPTNSGQITLFPTETSLPIPTAAPTLGIGSTQVSPKDGMTMVYVPAGDFLMGSPDGEGDPDEHPQHTVYLNAYWIDQTEVTNAMYEKCVTAGACTAPSDNSSFRRDSYYGNTEYDNYPVIYVSWYQANTYCQWAGRELPTEAQWEKAARGTDGRTYPWGNQAPDSTLANYNGNVEDTTEVGSYPAGASPYGALDMAGNVWEWVADWYGENYYASSPTNDPAGPASGDYRTVREGSWNYNEANIRSADRNRLSASYSSHYNGLRCSLSASVSP